MSDLAKLIKLEHEYMMKKTPRVNFAHPTRPRDIIKRLLKPTKSKLTGKE